MRFIFLISRGKQPIVCPIMLEKTQQTLMLLILILVVTACAKQSEAPTIAKTAIENATVVDAVNGVRANQTIVFEGDEILSVGSSDIPVEVERRIDGTGKFVIPGLWDMHVHLSASDIVGDSMLPLLLSYGITSVRDTGGVLDELVPMIERGQNNIYPAQRIFFSGPLLDGKFKVYDGSSLFRPNTGTSNTIPEQAESTVAELKKSGASFIKIYEMVDPEVFEALVEAAEKAGLPIAAHVPLATRASEVGGKLDSMEHLRNVLIDCTDNGEEMLQLRREMLTNKESLLGGDLRASIHREQRIMALNHLDDAQCDRTIAALQNTIQVPTLSLGNPNGDIGTRPDWLEAVDRLPEPARSMARDIGTMERGTRKSYRTEFALAQKELVGRMHRAGVVIGAGTDIPVPPSIPGHSLHMELEALVSAGLSPLEAIGAATVTPAMFFSLEDEMGSVDIGKKADMLILSKNPLEDIHNTQSIDGIVIQGLHLTPSDIEELANQSREGSLVNNMLGLVYKAASALGFSPF